MANRCAAKLPSALLRKFATKSLQAFFSSASDISSHEVLTVAAQVLV
jgi:predicted DsbA family dithiol-disulfide isomerase